MNHRVLLYLLCLLSSSSLPAFLNESEGKVAEAAPIIVSGIHFSDGRLVGIPTRKEIAAMGQRELKLGGGHSHDFLGKDGKIVETRTIAAYRDAILDDCSIEGAYATACAGTFAEGWSTWEFMQKAKPARVSHFDKEWLGTLSVSFLSWCGSDEEAALEDAVKAGKNLKDYQKSGGLRKLVIKEKSASFESHRSFRIEWMASGDIDGDGIEDRLVRISRWAIEGSAFMGESFVVKRKAGDQPCSILEDFLPESSVAH